MSTHRAPASGKATALSRPVASGDDCQCADCRLFFPCGSMWCFPHGNICDDCKEDRSDAGLDKEAFGSSPRQESTPSISHTAALLVHPDQNREPKSGDTLGKNRRGVTEI
jgi:hypothetical protein